MTEHDTLKGTIDDDLQPNVRDKKAAKRQIIAKWLILFIACAVLTAPLAWYIGGMALVIPVWLVIAGIYIYVIGGIIREYIEDYKGTTQVYVAKIKDDIGHDIKDEVQVVTEDLKRQVSEMLHDPENQEKVKQSLNNLLGIQEIRNDAGEIAGYYSKVIMNTTLIALENSEIKEMIQADMKQLSEHMFKSVNAKFQNFLQSMENVLADLGIDPGHLREVAQAEEVGAENISLRAQQSGSPIGELVNMFQVDPKTGKEVVSKRAAMRALARYMNSGGGNGMLGAGKAPATNPNSGIKLF